MSFLKINVESIFMTRACLGLAGLTHAGQWGAYYLRLIGLTRVVRLFGFDFGRRAPRGCEASSFGRTDLFLPLSRRKDLYPTGYNPILEKDIRTNLRL
jgi:hypothetical protein